MGKAISLTKGYVALVDDDDYEELSKANWSAGGGKGPTYAQRSIKQPDGRWATLMMHRQVMGLSIGDKTEVDHIDLDGLNNQKSNLRLATSSQQGANRSKQVTAAGRPCSSRFRGVHSIPNGHWQAKIRVNGERRHLGTFTDEETAARAYDDAALAVWGEYARINFSRGA